MARSLVIVESPAKAATLGKFLGRDFQVAGLLRPRPRPREEGHLGRPFEQLRAQLPHRPGQGAHGRRARPPRPQGGPHLPRRRPRPRGRGDLLAPPRAAEEGGARGRVPPRRVPRDHEVGGEEGDRPADADLPRPRRRAAGAPDHRQARRLRGVGAAVAEGLARPLGRARPDGCAADHRRARERARAVRGRAVLLGAARPRQGRHVVPGAGRPVARRQAELRRHRPAPRDRAGGRGGAGARRALLAEGRLRRGARAAAEPGPAVHDAEAAAGRRPLPRLLGPQDDDARAAALRGQGDRRPGHGRPHHVHEDRLRPHRGRGAARRPRARARDLRGGGAARRAAALQAEEGRAGRARGDPADHARPAAARRSHATSSPTS